MPPAGEMVNPKPLSGDELKRIILADVSDAIGRNCLFTGVTAFGQVAYELTVKLHFQNLSFPGAQVNVVSHVATPAELAADPSRENVQGAPPLEGDGETVALERHREIASPNQARVEFEIPVPIIKRTSEGHTEEATAKYPAGSAPPTKHVDTDRTDDAIREFEERKRKRKKQ